MAWIEKEGIKLLCLFFVASGKAMYQSRWNCRIAPVLVFYDVVKTGDAEAGNEL